MTQLREVLLNGSGAVVTLAMSVCPLVAPAFHEKLAPAAFSRRLRLV